MKLSIIIPVFNEEKTVFTVLEKLERLDLGTVAKELIVVDDGSTDRTPETIENFIKQNKTTDIIFARHPKNKGKGAAVKTAIEKSNGDYLIIQDADLEYHPSDINKLLAPIIKGKSEVVYGTRLKRWPNFSRDEKTLHFFLHYMGNKFLSLLASILYGQWLTDMETGYKIFPKKPLASLHLHATGFNIDPELTAKLIKKRYKILEVSISTNPRSYKEGKKLNTVSDGFMALWTLLKYRIVN